MRAAFFEAVCVEQLRHEARPSAEYVGLIELPPIFHQFTDDIDHPLQQQTWPSEASLQGNNGSTVIFKA
jgi:hypothetical protein